MAYLSQFTSAESMLDAAPVGSHSARRLPLATRISALTKRIGDYIETVAGFYAAAAMYEQLYRLSDAELHRRGLSRADLARDILAARNQASRPDRESRPSA